jgi:hypothetical protein
MHFHLGSELFPEILNYDYLVELNASGAPDSTEKGTADAPRL